MCVIFLSYKQHQKYPLILLANRDEFYDRPTAAADVWEDFPYILAGKDLVGNGTWLGVTESGRFSAVTNFRDSRQEKAELSRGNLVADFLKTDISSIEYLKDIRSRSKKFAGFNLLVGEMNSNRNELFYFSNRQGEIRELDAGLYGLSNHLLDTPWKKVRKGKDIFEKLLETNKIRKETLFELLADKALAEDGELPDTGIGYEREKLLSSIFIETPVYGTRCSTLLTFSSEFDVDFEERVFV